MFVSWFTPLMPGPRTACISDCRTTSIRTPRRIRDSAGRRAAFAVVVRRARPFACRATQHHRRGVLLPCVFFASVNNLTGPLFSHRHFVACCHVMINYRSYSI